MSSEWSESDSGPPSVPSNTLNTLSDEEARASQVVEASVVPEKEYCEAAVSCFALSEVECGR